MRHRTLGISGTVVSELALGTMTFGAETDEAESRAILNHYVEEGGNFIDTADVYAGGRSEEIIGRWMKAEPARAEKIVLTTKARFPTSDDPNDVGVSRRHLARALDASLRRLDVDHIDLYQLHAWEQRTPIEESLRFLDDAIRAGKIGHYGFSNYTGWQISKAAGLAARYGHTPPVTLQSQYNLLSRGIELEIVEAAADAGLAILPWSPLAGGWLTGKYKRGIKPDTGSRYAKPHDRATRDERDADDRVWAILDVVAEVADAHTATQGQIALAWLLARPAVTSVILGARTLDQLAQNLPAAGIQLSNAEIEDLDRVSAPRFDEYPYSGWARQDRYRPLEGGR